MIAQLIAALIALIKDMPWSMRIAVVVTALAVGAAWYSYSSKQEAVSAATSASDASRDAVVATTSDERNKRISTLEADLCACRVRAAVCEARPVVVPPVARRVIKPVRPVEPEPEACE